MFVQETYKLDIIVKGMIPRGLENATGATRKGMFLIGGMNITHDITEAGRSLVTYSVKRTQTLSLYNILRGNQLKVKNHVGARGDGVRGRRIKVVTRRPSVDGHNPGREPFKHGGGSTGHVQQWKVPLAKRYCFARESLCLVITRGSLKNL